MRYVDIVFDGPPSDRAPRFVEIENDKGISIRLGEWLEREDGFWVIRIPSDDYGEVIPMKLSKELYEASGDLEACRNRLQNIGSAPDEDAANQELFQIALGMAWIEGRLNALARVQEMMEYVKEHS